MIRNAEVISFLADKYSSFYLYDERVIAENISSLKKFFPSVKFLYSLKCNNDDNVLRSIFARGVGADAASIGEVFSSARCGLSGDEVFYSAPGKSDDDLEIAAFRSVLIADSINEVMRIERLATENNNNLSIGLRINPNFYDRPSKFGIDEDEAVDLICKGALRNVRVNGIHIHLRSQVLDAEKLAMYYSHVLKVAERFKSFLGELAFVNMGSGFGVNYSPNDKPLDLACLSEKISAMFKNFVSANPNTKLIVESGRFITCKSGIFVTHVVDKKCSRGKKYIILNHTLNGFIRPSLARLIDRENSEPLFTSKDAFEILTLHDNSRVNTEKVTLAGNLCTTTDIIAEDIDLPELNPGDVIIITNAGSYASVLTPFQFSSWHRPAELFLTESGEIKEGWQR